MSDKLSNLAAFGPSPGKIFTRVFVTIFLVVVIISTAVTFILPEIYASSVALKMEQSGPVIDPYFRQTQYELMASDVILFPVIEKLDLNKVWGKKYSVREPLNTIETFKILKSRLEIRPDHGTKMTRITVYGDDRVEAAKIANAVAESYRDYRTKKLTDEENRLVIKNGWTLVEICIPAEPGTVPVKPNKPLNITIGALGGIFAAGIVGGLAALVTSIRRKRRQNANAPA